MGKGKVLEREIDGNRLGLKNEIGKAVCTCSYVNRI